MLATMSHLHRDNKEGNEAMWTEEHPLPTGEPSVSHVRVRKISPNTSIGEDVYFGGDEGTSIFQWLKKRYNDETGEMVPIVDARNRMYTINNYMNGCNLIFT